MIDTSDLLAEKVFLQEHVYYERRIVRAHLKHKEKKPDDEGMEVLNGEGASVMEVLAKIEEGVKPSTKLGIKELPSHRKCVPR